MSGGRTIALIAGEASGDQLGAGLIEEVRRLEPSLRFVGIAGPAMRAAGCAAWFGTEELSVMGLAEVVRHLPRLAAIKRSVMQRLRAERPAVFVGIDAPDFNLRVAAALRRDGIPTVQYVCPSVWAWRRGRLRTMAAACDRVLCLLPFEASFLGQVGIQATFVGHPFADQIAFDPDRAQARAALGIERRQVVGLLPGSRVSEVTRLGPVFLEAARRLRAERPGLGFAAPMATAEVDHLFRDQVERQAPDLGLQLFEGRAREVMAASDVVLVASGTATLETMLVGRPMVVAYRVAPLTYWAARALNLVKVRHFSLPNILAGQELVQELLQGQVTAEALAAAVGRLLQSQGRQAALRERFAALGRELRRGASAMSARAVLEVGALRGAHPPAGSSL
jgi:lipid-A-disaccharide synthase